ncbi:Ig-like domain-containing protein, partial [Gammaproteobacteria bacterium]|nr:Ig-like domain-containing protein [Gammaproteobacteria bacterium]
LTWSSTNATSCSASWTTQTGTSGSEAVTISTVGNNSFSISCTGDGGSRSASVTVEGYRNTDGVVVDGYISGAEVCIDENDNWTCDSNENSTTSDNDGTFTIRYANGNLVSIGGTDLDSQTLLDNLLITHKLTGHSDFKAVTPVTSIAAFMEDSSLVNAALGIDSSIDVFTFDPVANKGDGGINDFLYEKGNQLTVLAFALQNITNNLNTTTETTQDYFKAITEEIEKEYTETETKIDIETEAFVTKVFDNVITAKSVTIDETAKANTTKALAGVLPVIEVKSSDDLTTGVIRFAVSTLQTDIQSIANGTATAETVSSYTEDVLAYIAEDQNIDADEITPDISAISDTATTTEDTAVTINVILNDSYLTSSPVSVSAGNATNGTTILAESSPEQVLYTPNSDYNGTDTFTYTITQGDKISSADVTVTIEAVNDAPTIDMASTIQVAENQTAVTSVSISDVDEDDLTLTLGGADADSFNLSDENVLTFKEAPDYETKTSYSITLTLTDGIETVVKNIIVNLTNINDNSPVFTSGATFSASENQTAIGTVTATDADGDALAFSITGSEIQITSNGTLSFISSPDYEAKNTYLATVKVTDGLYEISQDIVVNITDTVDTFAFKGKAIDGYISGANIFIDQNYNFKLDSGELTSITDSSGSFVIGVNDESKFNCLKNRPIVANVQAGAIDLSSGVITEPFEMVLPSIKDTGNDKIVISPFTNLLSDAIIQGKVASGIKDEIHFSEGCGDVANLVANSISEEITQLTNSIGQSLGISFSDLLNDFIASSTNTAINEESAQSIAEFFKYFKKASDLFDSELSAIHNKSINTDLAIREDAVNTILANPDVEEIPMNFSAIYRTEPNSAGWFIEEKIDSKGASLNRNGDIIHHACFNSSENCKTSNLTLDSLRDASERYFRTSSFLNNSYDADGYNYILNTEDSQIVYYNVDGTPKDRTCIYQNWLYLIPKNSRENFTSSDRYNTGISAGTTEDKCKPVEENLTESLFIALVDNYDDGVIFEQLDVRITNPNYLNSSIIKNKVSEIYENRDNLDINPLILELSTIPRNFKDLNIIRNKLTANSSDQVTIYWTKRNSAGEQTESARISIKFNPDDDEFTYGTFVNSNSGSEYTEITNTKGQQARDDLFATISSKSSIFGTEEFVGSAPVTDNRITISGKTIDGYIEGANVFFDVN